MSSNNQHPYGDMPLKLEGQSSESKPSALNEHFTDATTKEALRGLILHRFSKWLDDVLAEEKPLDGIAAELLAEVEEESASSIVDPTGSEYDLYSTWSSMTALTQEIKLQGRAFKDLSDKMEPLTGLGEPIDKLLEAHKEALSDARHTAEEAREISIDRENKLKLEAYDRVRRELIGVIIDIRDKLIIGLSSANESTWRLDEYRNLSWLNKVLINKSAGVNHMLEIVDSLKKGYRLGLDRIDEALQKLGVQEIVCAGKPFDPRIMNAVDVEETVDTPDGMVLEVYRAGYMIDTEVHQPAQVKVARAPVKNS